MNDWCMTTWIGVFFCSQQKMQLNQVSQVLHTRRRLSVVLLSSLVLVSLSRSGVHCFFAVLWTAMPSHRGALRLQPGYLNGNCFQLPHLSTQLIYLPWNGSDSLVPGITQWFWQRMISTPFPTVSMPTCFLPADAKTSTIKGARSDNVCHWLCGRSLCFALFICPVARRM